MILQIIIYLYIEYIKIFLSYSKKLNHIAEPELKCMECGGSHLFDTKCLTCPNRENKGTFWNIF